MGRTRKITVEVPLDVLKRAQKVSGEGVTGTVRRALDDLARADVYDDLLALRGKVQFTEELDRIREDRD
ncbi:MAG TPA: hypothetical protein VF701_19920 [Thermoanaerobaculia bacterium]